MIKVMTLEITNHDAIISGTGYPGHIPTSEFGKHEAELDAALQKFDLDDLARRMEPVMLRRAEILDRFTETHTDRLIDRRIAESEDFGLTSDQRAHLLNYLEAARTALKEEPETRFRFRFMLETGFCDERHKNPKNMDDVLSFYLQSADVLPPFREDLDGGLSLSETMDCKILEPLIETATIEELGLTDSQARLIELGREFEEISERVGRVADERKSIVDAPAWVAKRKGTVDDLENQIYFFNCCLLQHKKIRLQACMRVRSWLALV